ncbi:ankyrin repeat-containing domain protein [Thelephora terrestris]|uniref:Ankyrin repeat-containing domain protein n=1 Tax=Thelephora terrestris TaxID=56493 RepID=A0A9P6HM69_9AGAM|nr:ankyrin repeat-containing domain protein [Thelephora terrestris]
MPITVQTAAQNKNPSVVNSVDVDGRTALHWAAFSGALDITQYLLEQKAEVDKIDGSGWTALHIAGILLLSVLVSAGNEDVVRELVGAGADVKKPNDKGLTPLHYAASKSRVDIAKFLIERGADNPKRQRLMPKTKRTNIHCSTGMIAVLLKPLPGSPKTRLNTADRIGTEAFLWSHHRWSHPRLMCSGNTPLHLAMESAHAEAAIMLIEAGADRSRENLDNEIPEQVTGVGGQEQKRAREYVVSRCGVPT